MNYDWILFDADETLFNFDAFKGLQRMLSLKGVDFTQQDFLHYQATNKPLWVDYQNGTITADELKHRRFLEWAQKLDTTTTELNRAFLEAMADICTLLPGAKELVEQLHGKVKMGIITNGFTELQAIRLERTGMTPFFDLVVISEQVGIAKPDLGIFEYAMARMGMPAKERVLMVGDNPDSDIIGGQNFGIDTCWLNVSGAKCAEGILPTYTVSSLSELAQQLS
ncbi:noncanonical pyrimidine nucleotidase, YjjG family [Vibrio azureus]|uniref:Putative pyrimidine 5'-nucleotidase n=1 Tax=Vibrio azureus NBRC 104587 TaxID=1219077 RepID=U3ASC2_9VIBR|nr:pyrimidine 5'-nucleotidase [Vibrio azureus]AUI87664.1 noncanonical pyrimidine nucleotidase, YjjG family [Vibrio azureus]GAD76655.1 putative pyrimidine 5'-nucleotidase [Vibrio azureus NBRC 104587]